MNEKSATIYAEMLRKEIGARIKKRRKECGLTQKALAEKINRAVVTVQQYESGIRFPDMTTQMQIIKALDCEYEDLFKNEIHIGRGEGLPPDELRARFDKIREEAAEKKRQQTQPTENKPNETSLPPSVDISGLTDREIHELQIYRDFLIFRRGQSAEPSPDNSSNS